MKRQKARRGILLASFLLFPITIFYFSPCLIVWGAFQGIVVGVAFIVWARATALGFQQE